MPTRNPDKNKDVLKELEKTISPVLVVNNSSLKPYVELFEYEPENIYQQPLGSLVGFFEVKEYSEDSAYVVNFLTSVLKKEYYINPKRQVTESLDSALHKVNMALSELAKNGNVEWLGKIHAAICVLEKNNAHFSVAGNAKIFLFRNQTLSEISADLASDSLEPHPLKTFVNVSSGRLEKSDRLLITSEDIFHILSAVEIKKNFQRFQGDKFVQFLKTALSNQMEMIASVVVDMSEAIPLVQPKTANRKKSAQIVNAFSETSYANSKSDNQPLEKHEFAAIEEDENPAAYTDKKTGHIYIQGESLENTDNYNAKIALYVDLIKEKISQGSYVTRNEIRKRLSLYKKQLAKKRELRRLEKEKQQQIQAEQAKLLEEQRVLDEIKQEERIAQERELEMIRLQQEKIENEKLAQEQQAFENEKTIETIVEEELIGFAEENIETTENEIADKQPQRELTFKEKLQLAKMEAARDAELGLNQQNQVSATEPAEEDLENEKTVILPIGKLVEEEPVKKDWKFFAQQISQRALEIGNQAIAFAKKTLAKRKKAKTNTAVQQNNPLEKIVPHFSKISRLFSRFTSQQKKYTLGALALIFIVPLFIVHFLDKPKTPTITELQNIPPSQSEILASEKNIKIDAAAQSIFANANIISTLFANDNPIVITKTSVVVLQNGQPKEFVLPADSGTPKRAAFMKDLSLVLILTDNSKVLSFSPVSTKFTANNIDLSGISPESLIGTYLTYMYVLDPKTNQIYRFPRAEGGFGARTNWLKDSTVLADTTDMTIDDNIFAIQNNQILKFFKGQKQTFTLEASSTPVQFDKIFTTPDLQNFYALDKENSRVIQFSKDGAIVAQFQNKLLSNGTSLSVNEQNKVAYIATPSGLISLSLQ
ncbi:MAG: hypothetical protein PHW24_03715 [Candidatus Moranbacteria bacterium]|nr:hypothetical protein [Candidatus Moranbacteria bacterium]